MNSTSTRDLAPDALRGFALLGILIVNIPFLALLSAEGARGVWLEGLANGTAAGLMIALFAGKFYILFAFLFGYSANYLIKGERSNRGRWARRSFALMLFGAVHFTFFWHGDILFLYGLLGLLLIPFLFRTDRTLKIWTRVIYSFFTVILVFAASSVVIFERLLPEEVEFEVNNAMPLDDIMRDGSFTEAIAPRLELWIFGFATGILLQGGFVFAAFLYGLRAGRERLLSKPLEDLKVGRKIKIALLVGLPLQVAGAVIAVLNEQSTRTSFRYCSIADLRLCRSLPSMDAGWIQSSDLVAASRSDVPYRLSLTINHRLADLRTVGIGPLPRSATLGSTSHRRWCMGRSRTTFELLA